jgi:hypothetical protein
MVQAVGGATPSGGIKSGSAGGRDGHLCPMGSLDPRRCATPQAVAKLQTERPLAARGEERSGPGVGGVEAGRQALADDSTAGRLLGAESGQDGFGRRPGGLPKDSRTERPGGAGGSGCFMGRSAVEPSRVADRSGGGSATEEHGMTASGRGRRSDSFEW